MHRCVVATPLFFIPLPPTHSKENPSVSKVGTATAVPSMCDIIMWGTPGLIDEFRMLWLPWATHRKVWHKMEVWTATRAGWPSKRPFCAILFNASPRATKACETRLYWDRVRESAPRVWSQQQGLFSKVHSHNNRVFFLAILLFRKMQPANRRLRRNSSASCALTAE